MEVAHVRDAIASLEKANAGLEPELLTRATARELLDSYVRARRLADFGIAQLTRKLDDPDEVARATGTSLSRAKETLDTGKMSANSDVLSDALRGGDISLDQASQIAVAEQAAPGSAEELVSVAKEKSFHVLRDEARKAKLEAEQHRDLGARQRAARSARSYTGDLGMVHVHLSWEPHIGTPIVNRAEAEADRLRRAAKKENCAEPFERHLADAYAALLSGSGRGPACRPELVVVVSHEVATRGWNEVRDGETCKIPGVGPVPPQVARNLAQDAFLSGLFYDGTDLRHFRRWTRSVPVEVRLALELGSRPALTGSGASTAATASAPRPTTSNRTPPAGPLRPTT